MHKIHLWLLLALLMLAACEPDPPPTPRVDPLTGQEARAATLRVQTGAPPTMTAAAFETIRAIIGQTLTPPPSPTRPERVVTRTPTPTRFVESEEDLLGNVYLPTDWLAGTFTATDGNTYSLDSFSDMTLIIHTFDPDCDSCGVSHQNLWTIAQTIVGDAPPIVYLNLNINSLATSRAVANWSSRYQIPTNTERNWYVGSASAQLLRLLTETFGQATDSMLIVVDPQRESHFAPSVNYAQQDWTDVLGFYVFSRISPETEGVTEQPVSEE
ncbi:MAG: hypothetical protein H6673_02750 [Anaerolineales bacterium]|nr:hypothetical protein [Anaerolineales bacterium]